MRRASQGLVMLAMGCGQSAPAPAALPEAPTAAPTAASTAASTAAPTAASTEAPSPATEASSPEAAEPEATVEALPVPSVRAGDIHWIMGRSEVRALFVEDTPHPMPETEVVGTIELHHSHRELRLISEVAEHDPSVAVIGPGGAVCEARVRRARLFHTLFVSDDEAEPPHTPVTYLVLDLAGCPHGQTGVAGMPPSQVRSRSLLLDALTTPATPDFVEAVRHVDDGLWGGPPLPSAAFRMLALPEPGVTVVVGTGAWVVREGVVLSGASPITLIEAGPLVFFEVQTPSESWVEPLSSFRPRYLPAECEVIDDSGSPMNVRAGPRSRSPVVASLARGARVTVDDGWGSWRHLATSPPGWAHESGLRCADLRERSAR